VLSKILLLEMAVVIFFLGAASFENAPESCHLRGDTFDLFLWRHFEFLEVIRYDHRDRFPGFFGKLLCLPNKLIL